MDDLRIAIAPHAAVRIVSALSRAFGRCRAPLDSRITCSSPRTKLPEVLACREGSGSGGSLFSRRGNACMAHAFRRTLNNVSDAAPKPVHLPPN